MYRTVNKDSEFWKYDCLTGKKELIGDKDDLLLYVYRTIKLNGKQAFANIANTIEEAEISLDADYHYEDPFSAHFLFGEYIKRYAFTDGYGLYIRPKDFKEEALRRFHGCPCMEQEISKKDPYVFRYDPVPYTGVLSNKNNWRKPKIKRTLILAADTEYGRYIRNKAYQDRGGRWFRNVKPHESWKKEKKRKQWM